MSNIKEEIELGAEICARIKKLLFPQDLWVNVYKKVAAKFTEMKKKAIIYFPGLEKLELLKKIRGLMDRDFSEALSI